MLFCPTGKPQIHVSREEECIALSIFAFTLFERLIRVVFLPNTGGKDVLVLLIPSTIYNFRKSRIFIVALELLIWKAFLLVALLLLRV